MWKKKLFKILLFIGCFVIVERFCHKQTRGFCLQNIFPSKELPKGTASGTLPDLSQPFTFLDSGLECYAFVSADQKLVLKFFKQHHVRQAELLSTLLPGFEKMRRQKQDRLTNSFASCQIAYDELKEETGLLYLHLAKTGQKLPAVILIDKLGIRHQVSLDEVPFLVQMRAEKLLFSLHGPEAKKCLTSLMQLIHSRCRKGIADRDPTLLKNFGFLNSQAIVIDLGSFSKDPFLKHQNRRNATLFYETLPLRCLLTKEFPDLLPHFEAEFSRMLGDE